MSKLVTIGIPIYKRLEYLPNVLSIVAAQDYPNIELLVSDNGMNGTVVPEIVAKHYPKPFRFRQNTATVGLSAHFNQLIHEAAGEYFVVLADDDEISSNYVSQLVAVLEKYPQASVAISIQETMDEVGNVLRSSRDNVPEILSGPDFIRAVWGTKEYGFESFSTFLAKTEKLKLCGGFPTFWVASGDEDLLIVKLCLDNFIAFSAHCAFRKRFSELSDEQSHAIEDLARGVRDFLALLDSDPIILEYAASHRRQWRQSRAYLIEMAWKTYFYRWIGRYREKLTRTQWVKAAFRLPFIPRYYHAVTQTFVSALLWRGKKHFPWAYEFYRVVKPRRS